MKEFSKCNKLYTNRQAPPAKNYTNHADSYTKCPVSVLKTASITVEPSYHGGSMTARLRPQPQCAANRGSNEPPWYDGYKAHPCNMPHSAALQRYIAHWRSRRTSRAPPQSCPRQGRHNNLFNAKRKILHCFASNLKENIYFCKQKSDVIRFIQ